MCVSKVHTILAKFNTAEEQLCVFVFQMHRKTDTMEVSGFAAKYLKLFGAFLSQNTKFCL